MVIGNRSYEERSNSARLHFLTLPTSLSDFSKHHDTLREIPLVGSVTKGLLLLASGQGG